MSSTAKKKPVSRPEIKMTRAAQLRQKPLQQSNKTKIKADLPSEKGVINRSNSIRSLAPLPGVLKKKNHSSMHSMNSVGSSPRASRDALHVSTSSITTQSSSESEKVNPQKVTERLYKPPTPDKSFEGNYLRKTDKALPKLTKKPINKSKSEPEKSGKEITASQKVYDWLNRKAHSNENVFDQRAHCDTTELKYGTVHRRRNSDPKGVKAAKYVDDYNAEIQDGYNKDGLRFVEKYFQKSLVWLTPKVDSFLSARNLFPKLPSTTNEERYTVENRTFFVRPQRVIKQQPVPLPPQDEVDTFVDMIDMPSGEVSMEEFSGYVVEKDPSPVSVTLVAHVGTQTDRIMFDVGTNTYRPVMVNKCVGTEPQNHISTSTDDLRIYALSQVRRSTGTSTADIELRKPHVIPSTSVVSETTVLKTSSADPEHSRSRLIRSNRAEAGTSTSDLQLNKPRLVPSIRVEVGTSTQDMYDDISDNSVTPRASPVSLEETEVESSSAYGSYSSNSLRRSLFEKVNNIDRLAQNAGFSDRQKASKAIMTDEETSQVQSELNRLATERIEIIELLALNILNLPSSLTVELLEAKLNYSIGQTDQLLAMLEESWHLEGNPHLHLSKEVIHITQEIIKQSRAELEDSKKAIRMCLDEVKHIKAGGRSSNRFLNKEVMKMKRRAEIEAFRLERMWEQFFHERTKRRENLARSSYSSIGRPTSGAYVAVDEMENYVHYLSDLRQRSLLAASEKELNDLRLQDQLARSDFQSPENWETCSIGSTSSRSSFTSPKLHKDHLVELRRQIVADTEQKFPYTRSRSVSPSYYSLPTSYLRPSCSSVGDSALGLSFSSSTSNWTSLSNNRSNTYTRSNSLLSTNSRKSPVYKSSYKSSSLSSQDLLSPSRPSYRSAGRYSAK